MMYLFILLSLTEASIVIPLHKQSTFPPETHPFSLRGLSYSSSITNYKNYQYYIQASIGTPPQSFSMLLSLKSSWVFIDQKNCTQCRSWSQKFDNSTSSTFKNEGKYLIFDSVGPFAGYTGYDTVNIAGIDAKSQGIILVSKENQKFSLQPDGVFCLGFNTSSNETVSAIRTLYSQNSIDHMVFSIFINDLNNPSDLPDYGDSMLIIDGHDISKYAAESNFTYIKAANSGGFWQIDFDNATFDGINITSGYKAIISPGTSFILGPKDAINTILNHLHDNPSCNDDFYGQLYCDCDANYPDLIIQISGVKFTIKSAGYLIKTDNNYCLPTFDYSTIANTWTLGDAFLRRFYTFYDMENMKIGFATIGKTTQIILPNSNGSNGNNSGSSGSSGNGSGVSEGSGSSGNGSGDSGNGSGDSGNGSGDSDSSSSDGSSNKNLKIGIVIAVIALVFFVAWIFSLIYLCLKLRESRAIREARTKEENQRCQNVFYEEQDVNFQKIPIDEQRGIELKNKIDRENAELRRLEEEQRRESEIAEKRRLEAESNSNFIAPYGIAPFKEEICYPALQAIQKCLICEKDSNAVRGLLCGHCFCDNDLRKFLEKNIRDNNIERAIRCPYGNCPGKIGSFVIQNLASQNSWEKLNSYAKSKNLELDNYE